MNDTKEAKKVNYTIYRKNYAKAKGILKKRHEAEFKKIKDDLNAKSKLELKAK